MKEKINSLKNLLTQYEKKIEESNLEKKEIVLEKEKLLIELTRKDADYENLYFRLQEQKNDLHKLQETFTSNFEIIANKILDEKSNKFTVQNKENIKNILEPLHNKIHLFEKKIEESQKENIGIHASLKEQLITLQTQNLKITQEAQNLTRALKGNTKIQGNWGELILERVLEKSGLEKNREYFIQPSSTNTDGKRFIPDVIINLPNNKHIIIDSKVSLLSYERWINEDNEILKKDFIKEHILSIKKHIKNLSEKKYHDLKQYNSLDFTLLFIPIETAFSSAINHDIHIYNEAFEKNIIIVTPSTLLATLRTIDNLWTHTKQQENAFEIARLAGSLYDKFEGWVNDLLKIGKKIDDAKYEHSQAMNKLTEGKGNLISQIHKLKEMGAKSKKDLPHELLDKSLIKKDS